MNRTQKTTRALGTFGVYGRPGETELRLLALANEYRSELCAIHQAEHEATILLRNEQFPALYAALIECERTYAWIARLEKEIKAYHVEIRCRNGVTPPQEQELLLARAARKHATANLKSERAAYNQVLKDFRAALKGEPPIDWKNVKTLDRRRQMYDAIQWPAHVEEYAYIWTDHDIQRRELALRYQELGLGFATRAEIVEASQPKRGKDGPGMRYQFGRPLRVKSWQKLTLQFGGGGMPVSVALAPPRAGGSAALHIRPVYANNKAGGTEVIYHVVQQLGTKNQSAAVEYTAKFHRELPNDAVIQRWSLVVRDGNRYVIPLLSGVDFGKPTGDGILYYDLTWRQRSGGVEICYFWGDHVSEALVIPNDLVERRMRLSNEQVVCDRMANALLTARGLTPETGKRQGTDALSDYATDHASDTQANTALTLYQRRLERAKRTSQRAIRCIEKIYETVTARVCRLHAELREDSIDLAAVKRYDTRDLLRQNALSELSRQRLHVLAPGKLAECLKRYGLAAASGEVVDQTPGTSRNGASTDLFTTWINSLSRTTGPKGNQPCRRSQMEAQRASN